MGFPWVSFSTLIYTSELILCSTIRNDDKFSIMISPSLVVEPGQALWYGLRYLDRRWYSSYGKRRRDSHAQSVRLGRDLTKGVRNSLMVTNTSRGSENITGSSCPSHGTCLFFSSFVFRLLLFVDEADAFLRKRNQVTKNWSLVFHYFFNYLWQEYGLIL